MSLVFENISHRYGKTAILDQISLTAASGEILCLLGPSGCGKTTLLNLAAGILPLQAGKMTLDDQELASAQNSPPPEKRPVGLVFQEGALFPHLSVMDNVKFGIDRHPDRDAIASGLLERIGLADLGSRFPHTLSGGQQQRVAVARALAPKPRVILMDEPFASIDIMLRRRLREEIRYLLKTQNCITIMVTHDPEEAMEISDKLAIMQNGRIAQFGRPRDIYDNPQSIAVAKLTSEGTAISAHITDGKIQTEFGQWPINAMRKTETAQPSDAFKVFLRPFSIRLEQSDAKDAPLTLSDVRHTGQAQIVTIETPTGQTLKLYVDNDKLWQTGQSVSLAPNSESLIAFPS